MPNLLLSSSLVFLLGTLIGCMSTQEKAMSDYCLYFPENKASFFKYSNCMSQQRKAAGISSTTNSYGSYSSDSYTKSLEQRLSDSERKNSQLQREQRAKDSQAFTDRLNQESKKTYDDRMKWKPGDK